MRYALGESASIAFTVGYGYDGYDFSGSTGSFTSLDIRSWRVSTPMRWRVYDRWTLFGIPTLRSTAESGADFGDSVTGGALVGFSYKFSESLTLGPRWIAWLGTTENGATGSPTWPVTSPALSEHR